MMKNYGFNLELEKQHRSETDWRFGGMSEPCIATIPENERIIYLPVGEVQNKGEEKMDCASRGPVNILETKFNWLYRNKKLSPENIKWLEEKGYAKEGSVTFSDAFIAILSGTTRSGNSMKAPLQAIENNGLIPKSMLPQESFMTFDDYHNPARITPDMKSLGLEFKKRFPINYEVVSEKDYDSLYKTDMLDEAGFAWPQPINGEYPRTDNPFNHVWMGICHPLHTIFDNYIDEVDGDFIKKLASDYDMLDYGYRVYIPKENQVAVNKTTLWQILINWIIKEISLLRFFNAKPN